MPVKVLFILKRREDYNPVAHSPKGLSTGLFNSANFMNEMLNDAGVESNIEVAIDNNCIDRLVNKHKPTHVIIEALWVVPQKFVILQKLHPTVRWIIRLHSELPFLAGEGMAMDWLGDYIKLKNVDIGVNAPRMLSEARAYLQTVAGWDDATTNQRVFYMPNFYPQDYKKKEFDNKKYWVDIAHMVQAVAALKFARKIGKQLRFHINGGRIEMKGDSMMNNIRGFFQHLADEGHQLVVHEWRDRPDFLSLCAEMDVGLQCNFSETFNIVSADLISQGVPVLGSKEIPWSTCWFNSDPTDSDDIAHKLERTYKHPDINVWLNQRNLDKYTNNTRDIWVKYFTNTEI